MRKKTIGLFVAAAVAAIVPAPLAAERTPGDSMRGEIYVQGGTFRMGSTSGYDHEKPEHSVTVSDFWMMKTEVTRKDYIALMGKKPSDFTGDDMPVEKVNWYEAVAYANKLSERDGLRPAYRFSGMDVEWDRSADGWRLPTEAEWEYAARGGSLSRGYTYAGGNDLDAVAWYTMKANDYGSKPVGTKAANELGLHDLSGNVSEWCWDLYGSYDSSSQTDPAGASLGTHRVNRGGSSYDESSRARSAFRNHNSPDLRNIGLGFRLVRSQVR